jgi:hypothetical protein
MKVCFFINFFHQWHYSPLLGSGLFFNFVTFFTQTAGLLALVMSPSQRPLPTDGTTLTQNKRIHRHPCLECDSNPQSQRSSERRQ